MGTLNKPRQLHNEKHRSSNSTTRGTGGGSRSSGGDQDDVQCLCYSPNAISWAEDYCQSYCPNGCGDSSGGFCSGLYIGHHNDYWEHMTLAECNTNCPQMCEEFITSVTDTPIHDICNMFSYTPACPQCTGYDSYGFFQECTAALESGAWTWEHTCGFTMASGYTWPIEWGNDEYCQNLHPHADCGNGMYWGWNGEFCTCKDYFDMPNWLFKGPVLYDNIGVNSGGQCYNALTWFDYEPGDDCYSADASLSCTNECTVDWDSATQDMWSPESCCMIQYQSNPPYDVSNWQALMPDPVNDCSGIPNPSSQKYNCLQKSTGGPNTSGPIHSGGGGGLGMKPNPRRGIRSHHKGGRGRSRNASKRGRLIRR